MTRSSDILIIGAGLAGLFLALRLSPRPCTVICPSPIGRASSSAWAQGGLAAALAPDDTPEAHARDTILAGDGLVDPVTAHLIAEHGAARVRDLLELGVPFDRTEDGALALSLEAAHSKPRVARVAGDLAGKAIMDAVEDAVLAAPHITVIDNLKAVELLQDRNGRIIGALTKDHDGVLAPHYAAETVFCTGGAGGLYSVTTNPRAARADAVAMAYQAGALLSDLEFVQFHPTAIDIGRDPAPLATEALRGEGARLVDQSGQPFMIRHDPMEELAPRDRVARAVYTEWMSPTGAYLDTRDAIGDDIEEHFPTVYASCLDAGINPKTSLIPIAPAAHYHMGGIVTDLWGRTTLPGLSACGECTSTGAHGANRLASNSLLEAVVFSARIADRLRESELNLPTRSLGTLPIPPVDLSEESLQALRLDMAKSCGVVRNEKGLSALNDKLDHLIANYHDKTPARALTVSSLIVASALRRNESRGGHFREDFPETSDTVKRTFLHKNNDQTVFIDRSPKE